MRLAQILRGQVGTGLDEACAIERDAPSEPGGVGIRSGHDEHMRNVLAPGFTRLIIPPRDSFQVVASIEISHLRVGQQSDVRRFFDSTGKVLRHGVNQAGAPDEDINVLRALAQKHSRLSCRISAADHDDFFIPAQLRLDEGGAVIDANALKARKALERQRAIPRSGGDNHRSCRDSGAVFQLDEVWTAIALEARTGGEQHLCPEFLRLRIGPAGQLVARDTGGKTKIVLDS